VTYTTEAEMYPQVRAWLTGHLGRRFPRARVDVRDTHSLDLSRYVSRFALQDYFTDDAWRTYDIKVDITGFVSSPRITDIVFVECKNRPIALRDLAQLLGYCRIARPLLAFLISPQGPGDTLRTLILRHDRADVLEYLWPKGSTPLRILLGVWDGAASSVDFASILPPGLAPHA
jgi:hypothetical protein